MPRVRRDPRHLSADHAFRLPAVPQCSSFMAFAGLVRSEHSSGPSVYRGSITETGTAHLRRMFVEAAWSFRHRPAIARRSAEPIRSFDALVVIRPARVALGPGAPADRE